jgi:hypothetical protein
VVRQTTHATATLILHHAEILHGPDVCPAIHNVKQSRSAFHFVAIDLHIVGFAFTFTVSRRSPNGEQL